MQIISLVSQSWMPLNYIYLILRLTCILFTLWNDHNIWTLTAALTSDTLVATKAVKSAAVKTKFMLAQ